MRTMLNDHTVLMQVDIFEMMNGICNYCTDYLSREMRNIQRIRRIIR